MIPSAIVPCIVCGCDTKMMPIGGRSSWGIWESTGVQIECGGCGTYLTTDVRISETEETMDDELVWQLILERGKEKLHVW